MANMEKNSSSKSSFILFLYVPWLHIHFRFTRCWESDSSGVSRHQDVFQEPEVQDQPSTSSRSWFDMFRGLAPRTPREVDIEAQVCRPRPNRIPQRRPVPVAADVGSSTTVFVERNSFLINVSSVTFVIASKCLITIFKGKPINSMDLMRQTKNQCPESYFTFLKSVGCIKVSKWIFQITSFFFKQQHCCINRRWAWNF